MYKNEGELRLNGLHRIPKKSILIARRKERKTIIDVRTKPRHVKKKAHFHQICLSWSNPRPINKLIIFKSIVLCVNLILKKPAIPFFLSWVRSATAWTRNRLLRYFMFACPTWFHVFFFALIAALTREHDGWEQACLRTSSERSRTLARTVRRLFAIFI